MGFTTSWLWLPLDYNTHTHTHSEPIYTPLPCFFFYNWVEVKFNKSKPHTRKCCQVALCRSMIVLLRSPSKTQTRSALIGPAGIKNTPDAPVNWKTQTLQTTAYTYCSCNVSNKQDFQRPPRWSHSVKLYSSNFNFILLSLCFFSFSFNTSLSRPSFLIIRLASLPPFYLMPWARWPLLHSAFPAFLAANVCACLHASIVVKSGPLLFQAGLLCSSNPFLDSTGVFF